jgi:type II secretory pathway predicted ATPase ExeA
MWESFFGFKKTPFGDSPDAKQLFASQNWNQVKTRLEFLAQHHGVGLVTGEVGAGKSTAARVSPPRSTAACTRPRNGSNIMKRAIAVSATRLRVAYAIPVHDHVAKALRRLVLFLNQLEDRKRDIRPLTAVFRFPD